jgi:hypothetical protein
MLSLCHCGDSRDFVLELDVAREILCHAWTADDMVYCGTPYGEILLRHAASYASECMPLEMVLWCVLALDASV